MTNEPITFNIKETAVELCLVWLYHNSDSELGIKSSWAAQTNFNKMNGNTYHDPYHDGILKAVNRKRKIEQALNKLPYAQRIILRSNFATSPLLFPACLLRIFHKEQLLNLAPTAACLWEDDYADLLTLCALKINKKASSEQLQTIRDLVNDCKKNYVAAIEAIYDQLFQKKKKKTYTINGR